MKEASETQINDIEPRDAVTRLFRVASFPEDTLNTVLATLEISPNDFSRVRSALESINIPGLSPTNLIADSFIPSDLYPTPFPIKRYGDGSWPVFYSALEEKTGIAEVGHYFVESAKNDGLDRYYTVFTCNFAGAAINIVGQEIIHPQLISKDQSGWHFCQNLARRFRTLASALFAPSARDRPAGTCVPVFVESVISNARILHWVRLSVDESGFQLTVL